MRLINIHFCLLKQINYFLFLVEKFYFIMIKHLILLIQLVILFYYRHHALLNLIISKKSFTINNSLLFKLKEEYTYSQNNYKKLHLFKKKLT